MEIKKDIEITLTRDDVSQIISEHLKREHGINMTDIHYEIRGHNVEGDWSSSIPPLYKLDEVTCKGTD